MNKQGIANILNKYDDKTKLIYSHVAKIERDTIHKIKRQNIRDDIKLIIERVVSDENK